MVTSFALLEYHKVVYLPQWIGTRPQNFDVSSSLGRNLEMPPGGCRGE